MKSIRTIVAGDLQEQRRESTGEESKERRAQEKAKETLTLSLREGDEPEIAAALAVSRYRGEGGKKRSFEQTLEAFPKKRREAIEKRARERAKETLLDSLRDDDLAETAAAKAGARYRGEGGASPVFEGWLLGEALRLSPPPQKPKSTASTLREDVRTIEEGHRRLQEKIENLKQDDREERAKLKAMQTLLDARAEGDPPATAAAKAYARYRGEGGLESSFEEELLRQAAPAPKEAPRASTAQPTPKTKQVVKITFPRLPEPPKEKKPSTAKRDRDLFLIGVVSLLSWLVARGIK